MRVKKQICLNCKNEYIAKHPSSKYCGNSCRQYHFREKNGLTPNWGEKTYEKRITLGSIEPAIASVKPTPAQEKTKKVAKKREVTTIINNPEYLRAESIVKTYADQYQLIKSEQESLIKKFNAEVNSNPQAQFLVGGMLGGAAIGLSVGSEKEKGTSSLAGALFGLLGGIITAEVAKDDLEKAKVKRLNKLKAEIADKGRQLSQIQIYYHDFKFRLQKISKSIPKVIEETYYEEVPYEDVTNSPVELPKVAIKTPEKVFAGKSTNELPSEPTNAPIGLSELKDMKFEVLPFTGQYQALMGSPEENFNMLVYGSPGHGKSTFCADFATYLANNHGTVLYCASEEGLSLSLQKKFLDKNSSYIFFDASKSYEDLKSKIGQKGKYRFVVIDSINDINISPEQLKELRSIDKKRGFICIMQANKDGSYKGNNTYSHDSDIKIRLENYVPFVEKSRFK